MTPNTENGKAIVEALNCLATIANDLRHSQQLLVKQIESMGERSETVVEAQASLNVCGEQQETLRSYLKKLGVQSFGF